MREIRSTSALEGIHEASRGADVVSTDVFDTLLLRTSRSERRRIVDGELEFADRLRQWGHHVHPDDLVELRLRAQRWAFRSLDVGGLTGEVTIRQVVERQLRCLGLPADLVPARLAIEVEIEKRSLVPNEALAEQLRQLRIEKRRVVAISDTILPAAAVQDLIATLCGEGVVDAVYTSADARRTKRRGDLFHYVSEREHVPLQRMLHVGDDDHADVRMPRARGLRALHLPRPRWLARLRKAEGGSAEAAREARTRARAREEPDHELRSTEQLGYEVFGPILTSFSQLLWLYAAQAEEDRPCVLLFETRGGVGIREVFERTIAKFDLPLRMRRQNLMVSRLVAARAALLRRSSSVVQELNREFSGRTCRDAARALGVDEYELAGPWLEPFDGEHFLELMFAEGGEEPLSDVREQTELFVRHFSEVAGTAERIILCDTGLYGSTQLLLAAGLPDREIETLHFARSNYKRHSEEHFGKVVGLVVERTGYNPLDDRSSILRCWQLIEHLFEPSVPSVARFSENESGSVIADCGDVSFGALGRASYSRLLQGAMAYIEALEDLSRNPIAERNAWRRLKRIITRPSPGDVALLHGVRRSVDFGRAKTIDMVKEQEGSSAWRRLRGIKAHLWREGAIAQSFPSSKAVLFPALELYQSARTLRSLLVDRRRQGSRKQ